MIKKSYNLQMSYNITDAEKMHAEKAVMAFDFAMKKLNIAEDYIDTMFVPFRDHPDVSEEEIIKYRSALREFRDGTIEKFNDFKKAAFKAVYLMQIFLTDTQTAKLIKSFISSVEDLETYVNKFSSLFDDLKSKTFIADETKMIDNIKKEIVKIKEIIDDRMKAHIHTNILGKTWADNISKELQMNMEEKTPLLMELNQERQKQLNQSNK